MRNKINTLIKQITVPSPFAVGPTNTYLIIDEPITLIDTGPATREAREYLNKSLINLGYSVKDIKRVILTHAHLDHFGLARWISDISVAQVFIHQDDQYKVEKGYVEEMAHQGELVEEYLKIFGFPERTIKKILNASWEMVKRRFFDLLESTNSLKDKDIIEFKKFKLEVIHTPGHTQGSICLYDKENKILFSGDHLLRTITPNPVIEIPKRGKKIEFKSLIYYLESLKKTEKLDVKIVFPGHEEIITNHKELIKELYKHHEIRKEIIYNLIKEGNQTIYEISKELFGDLPIMEVFLAISEVIAHIELLEMEGLINFQEKNGVYYYRV